MTSGYALRFGRRVGLSAKTPFVESLGAQMKFLRLPSSTPALASSILLVTALIVHPQPAHSAGLSLNLSGCDSFTLTGQAPNQTLNCVTGTPTQGTCSLSATTVPSTSSGGAVVINANCTGSFSSYAWTRNGGALSSTSTTLNDSLPANTGTSAATYTYQLTASGSTTDVKSITVSVPAPGGTQPPPNGPVSCPGFNKTVYIEMPWQTTTQANRVQTGNYGGLGPNDALVVKFTAPQGVQSYANGLITSAEYGGISLPRYATFTTTPCDFTSLTHWGVDVASTTTITFRLQVGGTPGFVSYMAPGQSYYLNLKSTDRNGNRSCTSSVCNVYVDFTVPPGT
jgi:hypothetical protein